jgi:ubiquinone/menaquinone biosynthesis C-methylase UbiE
MDTVERFSSRVQDYIKYRPGYPRQIVDLLKARCGLNKQSVIADIGSGTGKLSEIFLKNGNPVFGVEPNGAMRSAAEELLAGFKQFKSIDGSAESTGISDHSVDFLTAAQAFHWFDQPKTKPEFTRILKPGGWVIIIWNERRLDATPFLRAYEEVLLKHGTDYERVRHENTSADIAGFFAPGEFSVERFDNFQEFDFAGLKGRLSSTSYMPEPGTAAFSTVIESLEEVFAKYQTNGRVLVEYDSSVYFGKI